MRMKLAKNYMMDASMMNNDSISSTSDECRAKELADFENPYMNYERNEVVKLDHLRTQRVHGIEDRMTLLTSDRNKYGEKMPKEVAPNLNPN